MTLFIKNIENAPPVSRAQAGPYHEAGIVGDDVDTVWGNRRGPFMDQVHAAELARDVGTTPGSNVL